MRLSEEAIFLAISETWKSLLGLSVAKTALEAGPPPSDLPVVSSLEIVGDADKTLVVACSIPLARSCAARMFELSPDKISIDEIDDAVRELVNVLAGRLAEILDDDSTLTLASISDALKIGAGVRETGLVKQVSCECEGEQFMVSVFAGHRNQTAR